MKRLGSLLEQYGTYEMNGIAFQDQDEIWWLETIGGHHWIARRVPDDVYVVMPNQLGIDHFDLEDALSDQKEYMCSSDMKEFIEKNHGVTKLEEVKNEYWDHLIGYWPCDREEDLENPILKNVSQYADSYAGKSDITFADQTWTTGNSAEEHLAPAPDDSYYQAVFNNVDIPLQAMQWLGLSISEWEFEGVGKTFEYTFMEEN